MSEKQAAVVGAGSWGTALSCLLAWNGWEVRLWSRRRETALELNQQRENLRYLPGVTLAAGVTADSELAQVVSGARLVVLAVPSHALRQVTAAVAPLLLSDAILINTAKGLEEGSRLRLSQVITSQAPGFPLAVLSGPSHAEEVGRGQPTTVVVAGTEHGILLRVQEAFSSPRFRVYTNPDLIGVELAGALKNIVALATGIAEGLGFGDNTRAALITRGLAEISRLGVGLGADPATFTGLAGLGDLVATCTSQHSRNRRAGMALGRGMPLDQVLVEVGMVVEGVRTTRVGRSLAASLGVTMPITEETHRVLFEGDSAVEAVSRLMRRQPTCELPGLGDCG